MEDKIMTLADMPKDTSCVITRTHGQGSFRHRLLEMGFIRGEKIHVVKNAPLMDPIEYIVMGNHVSLRRAEAKRIEVTKVETLDKLTDNFADEHILSFEKIEETGSRRSKDDCHTIRVALVGNPNCGKTSFFNHATGLREKVGNYGGVTVESKFGKFIHKGYTIEITDLPGTYSLTAYTPEERYVRQFINEQHPDIILNIVDASNLERNLLLTTQLIDLNHPMLMALNMYDELQKSDSSLDHEQLGHMLGFPVVPTISSRGKGIDTLLDRIIDLFEKKPGTSQPIRIHYGDNPSDEADEIAAEARFRFIRKVLAKTFTSGKTDINRKAYKADRFLTHKWLGFPILLGFLWIMFQATFTLGAYPQEWIENGIEWLGEIVHTQMPEGILNDLIVDGIIAGVGGVIVFLPNILILFFFISLLEDTGYMARAAFIMDRLMHKIGLHGKSFIPYLIGFGCGVPAIMATRTLASRKDRIITIMTIPFMSCSARLPVYLLFVSAFFTAYQGLVLLSIYLAGIAAAVFTALLMRHSLFAEEQDSFVMELPPYRLPTLRNSIIHMWDKSLFYLKKMGSVILIASVVVWALGYFPQNNEHTEKIAQEIERLEDNGGEEEQIAALELQQQAVQSEHSYIGQLGHLIEPIVRPLGFDWKMGVSILTGLGAKEIVVSSMGILYQADTEADEESESLIQKLQAQQIPPLTAYAFMLFVLLYFPCIAALSAIRKEAGTRWAFFSMGYTTLLAWLTAFAVVHIGTLFV